MVDFRHKNTKKRAKIFYGLAILFLLFLPFLIPYKALGSQILIFMLFAMGYDICLGYAGMLSFGHAAFFGMGAYTTGLLILHYHTNILLAIFAGILFSVLLAFPIGYTAIRRRGIYFAMVTLAYAQMFYFIAFKWTALTGGDDGLQGIPRPDFFGISLQSETSVYYFILGFLLIAILFAFRVVHSPFGHALVSIRESEQRAIHWIQSCPFQVDCVCHFRRSVRFGRQSLLHPSEFCSFTDPSLVHLRGYRHDDHPGRNGHPGGPSLRRHVRRSFQGGAQHLYPFVGPHHGDLFYCDCAGVSKGRNRRAEKKSRHLRDYYENREVCEREPGWRLLEFV